MYCITDYKCVGASLYPEYYYRFDDEQEPIYAVYDCAVANDTVSNPEELYIFTENDNAFKTKEVDDPVYSNIKKYYV